MSTMNLVVNVDGLSRKEQEQLQDILNDARLSAERLRQAAAKWMDLEEETRAKILAQSGRSLTDFWNRLTKVGQGLLHPQLATVGGRAAQLLGRLPLEEQERYLRDRIPFVVRRGKGFDTKLVDPAELNEDQRKQLFRVSDSGEVTVRDEEEQKAYFAKKAAAQLVERARLDGLKKVERAGWTVEQGRVWVKPEKVEGGLTRKDLVTMLRDLGD